MPKSTPDLSEFEALSRREPKQCVIGRRMESLKAGDQDKLQAALEAEHISHNAISKWLSAKGCSAGDSAIKKHRRQECCCGR